MSDEFNLNSERDYFEIDTEGNFVEVSDQFNSRFNIKADIKDASFSDIVSGLSFKKLKQSIEKNIVFGTINGHACLLNVMKNKQSYFIFEVVLKYDDSHRHELLSLIKYTQREKSRIASLNPYSFDQIVGKSPTIEQVKELAARVSRGRSTILLTGESGTGKELFAQAIHDLSPRNNGPFIPVNCAAIPENLFESELFGYEGGAFSGARQEGKPGKIEMAQNGTLFLDEISELPLTMQGKLLRVLQEREVERLGATSRTNVDIRIVVATNRDLKSLVQEGKFRQDLFYRLFVFELKIPPLRDREGDILYLAHKFLRFYNEQFNLNITGFAPSLKDWMENYDWPGNVRELKSFIERGMNIVDGDVLTLDDFFISSTQSVSINHSTSPVKSLEEEVENAETVAIQKALKAADGDKALAAKKLDIHLASLYRKLSRYGLN